MTLEEWCDKKGFSYRKGGTQLLTVERAEQYAHEFAAEQLEIMAQLTDNYNVDSDGKTSAARLRARGAEIRKASQ